MSFVSFLFITVSQKLLPRNELDIGKLVKNFQKINNYTWRGTLTGYENFLSLSAAMTFFYIL